MPKPDLPKAGFAVDSALGFLYATRRVLSQQQDIPQAIELAEQAQERLAQALALLRGEKLSPPG